MKENKNSIIITQEGLDKNPCRTFTKGLCEQARACQWIEEMNSCHDRFHYPELENADEGKQLHKDMNKRDLTVEEQSTNPSDNEGSKQNEEEPWRKDKPKRVLTVVEQNLKKAFRHHPTWGKVPDTWDAKPISSWGHSSMYGQKDTDQSLQDQHIDQEKQTSTNTSENEGSKQNEEKQNKYMETIRTEELFRLQCKNNNETVCKEQENCIWSLSKNQCLNKAIEAVRAQAIERGKQQDERFKKRETLRPNAQTAPAHSEEEIQKIVREMISQHEEAMERLAKEEPQNEKDVKATNQQTIQEEATRKREEAAIKKDALMSRYQREHPEPSALQKRRNSQLEEAWKSGFETYYNNHSKRSLKDIQNYNKKL